MKLSALRTLMVGVSLTFLFAAAGASYQEADLKPSSGSVKLKSGFKKDPYTVELIAGGEIKTKKGKVNAYVSKEPDFVLEYEAGKFELTIHAESKADTTLLIQTPDGKFVANDDRSPTNLNPLIKFADPKSGRYVIWVGTFGPENAKATLTITEQKVGK